MLDSKWFIIITRYSMSIQQWAASYVSESRSSRLGLSFDISESLRLSRQSYLAGYSIFRDCLFTFQSIRLSCSTTAVQSFQVWTATERLKQPKRGASDYRRDREEVQAILPPRGASRSSQPGKSSCFTKPNANLAGQGRNGICVSIIQDN